MGKNAAITLRIRADLKRRLEGAARKAGRSLGAEIAQRLENTVGPEEGEIRAAAPMMGKFFGARVPTDADFAAVRRILWGGMRRKAAASHS